MLPIVKYPDPRLLAPCMPVMVIDAEVHALLEGMTEVMKAENGIGLAANQVGAPLRMFIMLDQKGNLREFINPKITDRDEWTQINEGCLSAPGVFVQVPRSKTITVEAVDRLGVPFTVICQDVEAVCVQHEIDHLDGVFFLTKTSRNQRRAALKSLGLKGA